MRETFLGGSACARHAFLVLLLAASVVWAGDQRYSVPVGDSPALGPKDARVTVVEFVDYQ